MSDQVRTFSRAAAKHAAEYLAVRVGVARTARARLRCEAVVLAYHNIVPHGEPVAGDLSLHLSQRAFAEQLELMCRTHEVVPLEEALQDVRQRRSRPRVAITFDDGYRGALTAGVEELARRGLPATFFVAPGLLSRAFWWDKLAVLAPPAPERSLHAWGLREFRGDGEQIDRWIASRGYDRSRLPAHAHAAGEADLNAAARHPGVVLGSHSWSHLDLSQIHGPRLEQELRRPLAWLRDRFATVSSIVAYPYGLTSSEVAGVAQAAGYTGGMRSGGGWIRQETPDRYLLPRLNVPAGLSPSGLSLRLAGLLCR